MNVLSCHKAKYLILIYQYFKQTGQLKKRNKMTNSGDNLKDLPIDGKYSDDQNDIELVSAIFRGKDEAATIAHTFKDTFVAGLLFTVFASAIVDRMIVGAGSKNQYVTLTIKVVAFMLLFFMLQHRLRSDDD